MAFAGRTGGGKSGIPSRPRFREGKLKREFGTGWMPDPVRHDNL